MVFFYQNMSKNTKTFGSFKFSVYLCNRLSNNLYELEKSFSQELSEKKEKRFSRL